MTNVSIKVVVADDHPLVRMGIQGMLHETGSIDVLAAVRNSGELHRALYDAPCDVVVTDYAMPFPHELDGWPHVISLSRRFPHLKVLVYSAFDDPFLIGSLSKTNVSGLISKREPLHEIIEAIRVVTSGHRYQSPIILKAYDEYANNRKFARFSSLSEAETEVMGLLLSGLSVEKSAEILAEPDNIVRPIVASAMRKLGFHDEAQLFEHARDHQMLLWRTATSGPRAS